jgi:ophiobolin F synthase
VEFQFGWKPSEAEKTLIKSISDVIDEALMLTNDYWSWDREFEESRLYGHTLINAIEVYKRTQNVSTLVAQELVKSRIIACEKEYLRLKDEFYVDVPHSSLELKRWVEMLGYMLAGTNFWAASCPRHHSWKEHRNAVAPDMGNIPGIECDCEQIYSPDSILVTPTSSNTSIYGTKETSITASVSAVIIPVVEGHKLQEEKLPQVKDTWANPPKNALLAPINYINSLPSKGIRAMLLQALSIWIKVSDSSLDIIESIIDSLHNASLILDDIEDNSPLRRGKLATHMVFGRSQSINSGNYMFVAALRSATKLSNPNALPLLLETLQSLYLGQSWDLYWKFNMKCPSEAEYLQMIDNKTGALFNLILQIAIGELSSPCDVSFQRFVQLFGRYFQIRDDYMNLCSQKYSGQKGLYEDLDEGKFSYPLVYLANKHPEDMVQVLGIFRQRPTESSVLSMEAKAQIIGLLNFRGVLESVLKYLQELELDIEVEISKLEDAFGERNPLLRLILVRLSMDEVTMSF